ncbi:methyltransferase [Actinoallomurus sp. WRP9H-5]|nr:methyltransferase [Actinoallomurus rhizosphaericola]
MWMFRPLGVYRPQSDTFLLARELCCDGIRGSRVLDLCTGTGLLAIIAAYAGAESVTAVDLEGRAVLTAWMNTRLRRVPVRVLRGDLFEPIADEVFDVIVANPPYVPSADAPRRVRGRAWDAGRQGRAMIDRICAHAPGALAVGGTLLMVQSVLCGVETTLNSLRRAGLKASVVARRRQPFGPVMRSRAAFLEAQGLIHPGQRHEELVVVRADRN